MLFDLEKMKEGGNIKFPVEVKPISLGGSSDREDHPSKIPARPMLAKLNKNLKQKKINQEDNSLDFCKLIIIR